MNMFSAMDAASKITPEKIDAAIENAAKKFAEAFAKAMLERLCTGGLEIILDSVEKRVEHVMLRAGRLLMDESGVDVICHRDFVDQDGTPRKCSLSIEHRASGSPCSETEVIHHQECQSSEN